MNGDVNEVGGGAKRAAKRRMSAMSDEDSGEGNKRPATGFTMSIDERNELRMMERKAQSAVTEKVTTIVEREFSVSVTDKEKEIFEIDRRLLQLRKALHLVRYGAVTNYYALTVDKQTRANPESVSIHPAVRKLIGGKRPTRRSVAEAASATPPSTSTSRTISSTGVEDKVTPEPTVVPKTPAVVPGYFPPLDKNPDWTADPRGIHHKVKRRLVVGNVSKWIACDQREDLATHKWMIYVRGDRDHPDVSDVVARVRFLIHPSYHPHDLVEVTNAPFHLTRRGWGEFPARVQIHFRHPEDNKPIDLIHNLKLDKTYTGLQTLGAETNVDVWLHSPDMVRHSASLPDNKVIVEGEDLADPSHDYHLMHTEAEGWVISHTDDNSLRPGPDAPVASSTVDIDSLLADELPDMLKGEKSKVRCVGGTGIAGSNKKVLSAAATKENNCFNVKRYEMNGGHLSVRKADGENAAVDAAVENSPHNGSEVMGSVNGDGTCSAGDTTYIRCTDKNGKPFYLPVKILPSNHQRASSPCQPQQHQQHQSDLLRNIRRAPSCNRITNGVGLQANGVAQNGEPKVKILKPVATATTATTTGSRSCSGSPDRLSSRVHFSSAQNSPFSSPCPSPMRTTSPSPSPSPIAISSGGISLLKPSTLRPGTSLLRRNAVFTAQTPPAAVSISKPVPPVSPKSDLEKTVPEVSVDFWSRVMGRCAEDTQAEIENRIAKRGIHLLKKYSEYHKFLSERLFRLHPSTFSTADKCIFYIVRYLPLVTPMARDSMYRTVHPYSAKSTREFRSWNLGKQLAAEFLRARTIRRLVQNLPALKVHLKPDRYIVRLLREHGYTIPFHGQSPPSSALPRAAKLAAPLPASSYLPNMAEIESVVSRGKKEHALFTDIEIDVVSVDENTGSVRVKEEPMEVDEGETTTTTSAKGEGAGEDNDAEKDGERPKPRRACLMLPEDDPAVFAFVAATAKQIGIKMGPQEELAPGVFYPAAQKLFVRACKTMCESLIRKSHRAAFLRNGGTPPSAGISAADVFEAIDSEQDLDIFTNKGLGSSMSTSSESDNFEKVPKTVSGNTRIKEEQK